MKYYFLSPFLLFNYLLNLEDKINKKKFKIYILLASINSILKIIFSRILFFIILLFFISFFLNQSLNEKKFILFFFIIFLMVVIKIFINFLIDKNKYKLTQLKKKGRKRNLINIISQYLLILVTLFLTLILSYKFFLILLILIFLHIYLVHSVSEKLKLFISKNFFLKFFYNSKTLINNYTFIIIIYFLLGIFFFIYGMTSHQVFIIIFLRIFINAHFSLIKFLMTNKKFIQKLDRI